MKYAKIPTRFFYYRWLRAAEIKNFIYGLNAVEFINYELYQPRQITSFFWSFFQHRHEHSWIMTLILMLHKSLIYVCDSVEAGSKSEPQTRDYLMTGKDFEIPSGSEGSQKLWSAYTS